MCICELFPCAFSVFSGLFSDTTVLKLKSKLCLIQGRVKNFFLGLKYTDTYFVFIWELNCNWSYEDFVKREGATQRCTREWVHFISQMKM